MCASLWQLRRGDLLCSFKSPAGGEAGSVVILQAAPLEISTRDFQPRVARGQVPVPHQSPGPLVCLLGMVSDVVFHDESLWLSVLEEVSQVGRNEIASV